MKVLDCKHYCCCRPHIKTHLSGVLTKNLCVKCHLPIKIYIKYSVSDEDLLSLCVVRRKIVTGVLSNNVNEVIYNGVTYPVAAKSINVKGCKSIYDLDYLKHRTLYSNPQGFNHNDPRKRPYKSGEVRGYVMANKEFYITGIVKKIKEAVNAEF